MYFWNTSSTFRAVLKGIWAAFKATFAGIGQLARSTFSAIAELLRAAFRLDADGISAALKRLGRGYSDYGKTIGKAFRQAYDEEKAVSVKDEKSKKGSQGGTDPATNATKGGKFGGGTFGGGGNGGSLSTAKRGGGSSSARHITINVTKLVEKIEVHTTNLQSDPSQLQTHITNVLLNSLNDVNLATS